VLTADGRCVKAGSQALSDSDTIDKPAGGSNLPTVIAVIGVITFLAVVVVWRFRVHRRKMLDNEVHEMTSYDRL